LLPIRSFFVENSTGVRSHLKEEIAKGLAVYPNVEYPKEHYLQKSKKEPLLGIPKTCPNKNLL